MTYRQRKALFYYNNSHGYIHSNNSIQFLIRMEFIDLYALRPRKKTLNEDFNSLTLSEIPNKKQEDKNNLHAFNKESFISLLHRPFKDNHFVHLNDEEEGEEMGDIIQFSLMLGTQYESLNIIVEVCISIKEECIKYQSYLTKDYQIMAFGSDQINVISRYLLLYLNPKIIVGFMCIDPDSGKLSYQLINNSLGYIQKRIVKAPSELLSFIESEIKEIEKMWKNILPHFFNFIDIKMKLDDRVAIPLVKRDSGIDNKIATLNDRYNVVLEFIKQSCIEYPFMFDEAVQRQGKMVLRKTRFKFLRAEEKSLKRRQFDKMMNNRQYYSTKFTNNTLDILENFTSKHHLSSFPPKKEITPQKICQIAQQLIVNNWQGRFNIYSQLLIKEVKKDTTLMKSGFSQINLLHIIGKKIEDNNMALHPIVSKTTQPARFNNQTEILKIIGAGTTLFITRFFYSKIEIPNPEQPQQPSQEPLLNFDNKILLEYCPYKSVDSYLNINKKIITFQTKLFFLFQIAIGIKFLRDFGVIHNDIKPQNVLLKIVGDINKTNGTFLLRLIDFGQSYSKYQKPQNSLSKYKRGFTIPYASPQQVRNERFSEKIDVFSFGVMLYEIMFDSFPIEALKKGKDIYIKEDDYLKFYAMAPEKCKYYAMPKLMLLLYHLCLKCIDPNPMQRPYIDWIILILHQILVYTEKMVT